VTILVAGGAGRLGRSLARRVGVVAVSRAAMDVCDPAQLASRLVGHEAVINAAAYTHVDRAETERAAAFAVNATGAGNLARACAELGIPLVHVSTDYVFDGAATRPYREDDPVGPIGAYGESKAEGERLVLAAGGTVARTSWVFSAADGFVQRILARLATEPTVEVVDDRHGCPTWIEDLADVLVMLARRPPGGILHVAGEGATTWYGLALAIARAAGIDPARILPVRSAPTDRRPRFSVLDTTKLRSLGIAPRPWAIGLAEVLR